MVAPFTEFSPLVQFVGRQLSIPEPLYLFCGQMVQSLLTDAPSGEKYPLSHSESWQIPLSFDHLPGGQDLQVDDPVVSVPWPSRQVVQMSVVLKSAVLPRVPIVPFGHRPVNCPAGVYDPNELKLCWWLLI